MEGSRREVVVVVLLLVTSIVLLLLVVVDIVLLLLVVVVVVVEAVAPITPFGSYLASSVSISANSAASSSVETSFVYYIR